MDNTQTTPGAKESRPVGPFVGIVIILIIIILGGLYFWGKTINQKERDGTVEEILSTEDVSLAAIETVNASDEVLDIEKDLQSNQLDGLATELNDVNLEFKAE